MADRVRCVNCGHPLDHGALICGECGRVQPPAGEGPEWVESEEYEVGGGAAPEAAMWTVVWAVLALAAALVQFALVPSLRVMEAAAVPALGIVWTGTALTTLSKRLDPATRPVQVAAVLYGVSLALFIAGAGIVVLRVL